jgi:tetratricopeptide (TPR) repeat protein
MSRALLLFLCCSTLAFGQSREFKDMVMRGMNAIESKDFATALDAYSKAYQLEKKAQVIRLEGTFTSPYLPCYSIALAHEGLGDILEAESWVQRSKDALESDAIKRRGKELATYKDDVARIEAAAKDKREALEAEFNLALGKANDLLDQNRFDNARTAYEQLFRDYPDRNEPKLGLERVKTRRAGFLRELGLKIREASMNQDFAKADAYLDQFRQMDPNNSNLPTLVASVNSAKDRAQAPTQPEPEPDTTLVRAEPEVPSGPSPEELERRRQQQAERNRQQRLAENKRLLRSELLATLKPYRRGDASSALKQLREIDIDGREDYASFHWFKGLFLLASHQQSLDPEGGLLMEAREAIANAKRLQPNFEPEATIYPEYVIAFYRDTQAAGAGEAP